MTIAQHQRALHQHYSTIECDSLLCLAVGCDRTYLYTHTNESLTTAQMARLNELVARYQAGEPMAYLRGTQEFWSLEFDVTQDVLIPRPDTELLITTALEQLPCDNATIVELGTGSGAISIALAKERPLLHIIAVDICPKALAVAKRNAQHHGVTTIDWCLSDLFVNVPKRRYAAIISNPPYIAPNDPHLSALRYEPKLALVADKEGLTVLERVIMSAPDYLEARGFLLLEHGYQQQEVLQQLLRAHGYRSIFPLYDLAHRPRALLAFLEEGRAYCAASFTAGMM